jgi:FkbM family methyltransferase
LIEAIRDVATRLAPRATFELRGLKNFRRLHGLHGPPSLLCDLIPLGSVVIDAGANAGLYAYWFAKRAGIVYAFEPIPRLAAYLRRASPKRVRIVECALSDKEGFANLYIPSNSGEASLRKPHQGAPFVGVPTKTLDSFELRNVGLVKIDVEGHESAVLQGARDTIRTSRPIVFVEVEHRHGSNVSSVRDLLEETCTGWTGSFLQNGRFRPLIDFDTDSHQIALEDNPGDPLYVSNFLFLPPKSLPGAPSS